jgi:hypothetical protein
VAILDADGRVLARARIDTGATGFTRLMALLAQHVDDADQLAAVPIAIETDKNLLVVALQAAGMTVFAINPRAVARYRERHGQSGKKSDPGDAFVLAGLLRTDRHQHRCLLTYEIPELPPEPAAIPVPFPVLTGITKGRKFRTTWMSYEALAAVHHYLKLDRAATVDGSTWLPPRRWGEPLRVTDPTAGGGEINGVRRRWETLTSGERRRLIAPDGGSSVSTSTRSAAGGPGTASPPWPWPPSRSTPPTPSKTTLSRTPSG